jgi:hypothetical protein
MEGYQDPIGKLGCLLYISNNILLPQDRHTGLYWGAILCGYDAPDGFSIS